MSGSGKRRSPRARQHLSALSPGSGRRLAYEVLTAWQQRGVFAQRVLNELCQARRTPPTERAFAMDLAYGVIRRQATLDAVLKAFVVRPRSEIESGLWRLLRLGAQQILFMPGIPEHAAVNETVGVARALRRPGWCALTNAVLRSLAAAVTLTDATTPGQNRIPVDSQSSLDLDRPVFPSPETARTEYLVKAHSYPRWLMRDWLARYGDVETTRLCFWFNASHPPTIRVNTLKQTPDVVREILRAAGATTEPGRWPESLRLLHPVTVHDLPGFAEGWFSVQDESSIAAARMLDPQSGESILDLCAAPGGKTTHLAELLGDRGRILAVDADPERLRRLEESAGRLGLSCIECRTVDQSGSDLPPGPFDRALVDVPCSNTGVLSKRPEARWRIDPEDFVELTDTQTRLLSQALDRVSPGGCVVYSTCSIDPRENRRVIDRLGLVRSDFSLQCELNHEPGRPGDGGYQALLQKT